MTCLYWPWFFFETYCSWWQWLVWRFITMLKVDGLWSKDPRILEISIIQFSSKDKSFTYRLEREREGEITETKEKNLHRSCQAALQHENGLHCVNNNFLDQTTLMETWNHEHHESPSTSGHECWKATFAKPRRSASVISPFYSVLTKRLKTKHTHVT